MRNNEKIVISLAFMVTLAVFPPLLDSVVVVKALFLTISATFALVGLMYNTSPNSSHDGKILYIAAASFALLITSLILFNQEKVGIHVAMMGAWKRNNGVLTQGSFIILLLFFANRSRQFGLQKVLTAMTFLNLILTTYCILQINGYDFIKWAGPSNSPIGTLGNTNFSMNFLSMTVFANLYTLMTKYSSKTQKISAAMASIGSLFLMFQTRTIQSIISFLIGIFIFSLIQSLHPKRKYISFRLAMHLLVLILFSTLAWLTLQNQGPWRDLLNPYTNSLRDRIFFWQAALKMLQQNPIDGVGIDSFAENYRLFRSSDSVMFRGSYANSGVDDAHNFFMQYGATGGLILLSFYLFIVLFITLRCISVLRSFHPSQEFYFGFTIWVVFWTQNLVTISQPGVTIWGWIIGGALIGKIGSFAEKDRRKKASFDVFQMLAIKVRSSLLLTDWVVKFSLVWYLTCFIYGNFLYSQHINEEILIESTVKEISKAGSLSERSKSIDTLIRVTNKTEYPLVRFEVVENLVKLNEIDLALDVGKKMTVDFPRSIQGWDVVATIYEATDRKELARPFRLETITLDPQNERLNSLLGP